ncbi:serine/threonine-protein kinase [Kitasatospora sp. YST-16]|uniref:WD40 repeat domain-containing serine/threonine protein kinase n=1 Tax=Kitasatospora sp. YST-16 TaxID=2998080 RepID=UPI0022836C07|nr:serine/threonine-protein kinase [Kitasatospora sp. YST-16]WAL70980.1 serine/threonine-protein kinase [Kitasatospora sp. YST-16]WNW37018.1 serine/threonine-protein kinase [Streptomyces sp. Li-HN-5-13]
MAETPEALIGGRYRLLEPVGQGGMGRVWRAHDELLDRRVAVKELLLPPGVQDAERDELVRRVVREARAAARLRHPGIVSVFDVVQHRGAPAIVMEYLSGRSLAAEIRADGALAPERVATLGLTLLDALAEAHAKGVVHRDVKPDNVLLTEQGAVLTDFGIARSADATTALTATGVLIGTPAYLAPEQLEGKEATAATDLWALGATLWHAAAGQPPFAAPTLTALYVSILTQPPQPLPPGPAGPLAAVLAPLLAKDPQQRPPTATAAESLRGLRQTQDTTTLRAAPVPSPAPVPPPVPDAHPVTVIDRTGEPAASHGPFRPSRRFTAGAGWAVYGVAFGPDGRSVFAYGKGGVRRWDAGTGEELAAPRVPGEPRVVSAVLSPDGSLLATAGAENVVRLWHPETGDPVEPTGRGALARLRTARHGPAALAAPAGLRTLAISPDGALLAAGGERTVRLWDLVSGRVVADLKGHSKLVLKAAFAPDGRSLVTSGVGDVFRWDRNGRLLGKWEREHTPLESQTLVFHPSGESLTTGVLSKGGYLRDVRTGKPMPGAIDHEEGFDFSLAFSPDGRELAVGGGPSEGKRTRVWELESGRCVALLDPGIAPG